MRRRINSELLAQACVCFLLSILLFYALISGQTEEYVHPRLNGFLWFAAVALLGIALFQLPAAFKPRHGTRPARQLLFLVPMLAAVLIPVGAVQAKTISLGSSAVNSLNGSLALQTAAAPQEKVPVIPDHTVDPYLVSSAAPAAAPGSVDSLGPDANGVITITDDQFASWYQDINKDMTKYEGKTLKMKGQVFRMQGFAKDEMVPARYAMVCCSADLQPCGVLARGAATENYKDGDWVWVTGKISIGTYLGQRMPICTVTGIEKADPAKQDYIYFTY